MSCRPTAPSRLLSRPRLGLLPPLFLAHAHARDRRPWLGPPSCPFPVRLQSAPASAPAAVRPEAQDDVDRLRSGAAAADDSSVGQHDHVSPPPSQRRWPSASRSTASRGSPEHLARAAAESARVVDGIRSHKYWLMRTMYSAKFNRHSHLRHFWFNFKCVLWSDRATAPAQVPALSKYRLQATELHLHLERHRVEGQDGPDSHLLARRYHPLGLLVGALSHSAKLTMAMLDFLMRRGPVPFQITADCLRYLRRCRLNELEDDDDLRSVYGQQLAALRNPHTWPRHLRPSQMDLLLDHLTASEARALLFQFLEHNKLSAMPNRPSHLFVLDAFLRLKDVDGALQVLAVFPPSELESPDQELLQRIIATLHLEAVDDDCGVAFLSVLPRLLKLGVKPNQVIQNKGIRNALKFDLVPLAWDLVHHAQEAEIKIEGSCAASLLRHSFRKQDLPRLNQIMSTIYESTTLSQEPYVIMDMMNIVRLVCYFDRKSSPSQSLAHLLTIYDRAYNRCLLTKLGILGPSHAPPATHPLPDPPPMVCAFLVWTYVYVQRNDRAVLSLWERWAELIDQGDPLIRAAAQYDVSFNGFLLFFARSRHAVWNVPLILRFMLDQNLCKPSHITWSHCITAYLQWREHDHPAAREINAILLQSKAKVSEKEWKEYIQPRFPALHLDSPEARQFVEIDSPHKPDNESPPLEWA
ncbi:hypothetical protein DV737_g249, partial [Chaetothyriales sp. CBS 132003]